MEACDLMISCGRRGHSWSSTTLLHTHNRRVPHFTPTSCGANNDFEDISSRIKMERIPLVSVVYSHGVDVEGCDLMTRKTPKESLRWLLL